MADKKPMTPSEKEMMQEVADKKLAPKLESAYNKALTNTAPAPATPVKKANGGMTASRRADGIAQRGKTRGMMV
jgi:hypothetical protein